MTEEIRTYHYRRKVEEASLLFELSSILSETSDLHSILQPVLDKTAKRLNLIRAAVFILNRQSGEISMDSAFGFSEKEKNRGTFRPGEGVTGTVVQKGEPVVIENALNDNMFLNRTKARDNQHNTNKQLSYICVPIKSGNEVLGTIGADRYFDDTSTLDDDVHFLSIVASMIAQSVKLRQTMEEQKEKLQQENSRLKNELKRKFRPDNIVGSSSEMLNVFEMISQVAKSEATVLIRGESGTGKELVANAIHYNSLRKDKALIKVNCAALPESIIESELFGHEAGAFTGAVSRRKGRFELADGGTLFLDEIGELSPLLQVKLLRVLQEKEIERVGGSQTIRINVRIIAATNRNLEEEMQKSEFREDLFYRLNVFPIHVPPIRERKSDIILLADYFVDKYSRQNRKEVKRISSGAIDLLMSYHWPGNIRELENSIERAVLVAESKVIHSYHLPPSLQSAESSDTGMIKTLPDAMNSFEKAMIKDALKSVHGNQAKSARILGITERQMGCRIEKYDINVMNYKG